MSKQGHFRLARELYKLAATPPEDIRIIINEECVTDIQAWVRGPAGTPYEGGYFRVKLILDGNFPNSPPLGKFTTKIFHPNVSSDGDICVSTLKKDWRPNVGIQHILLVIKCLLIVPNAESALNEEAGRQILECYADYAKHARLMTQIHAISAAGREAFADTAESEPTGNSAHDDRVSPTGMHSSSTNNDAVVERKQSSVASKRTHAAIADVDTHTRAVLVNAGIEYPISGSTLRKLHRDVPLVQRARVIILTGLSDKKRGLRRL